MVEVMLFSVLLFLKLKKIARPANCSTPVRVYHIDIMQNLKNNIENEYLLFVDSLKELACISGLSKKKLCIAKTDFKDLHIVKKINKKFPNLEIWLTSTDISRKNIMLANSYCIKNIIPYPVDLKIIQNYFRKQNKMPSATEEIPNYSSLKGMSVMVVDDNQMNVDLLVETLSALNLEITTFLKPIEASKAAVKEKFDLFLLDVMMPEMSGFELAGIIKRSKINADTPIMFISALSDAENKIMGYNIGSCAYIEKPFEVPVVRSQIYNMLKTKCLQDALKDKKETFLAMVTHDLKTPIYAEICALELLNKNRDNMDLLQKEIISDILSATKYMKNLVENISQKYKVENENLVLQKSKCSLKDIAIKCIENTKYLFEEKRIKYILNCSARNALAMMDELEIKRVIHNLIINTIEHGISNSKVIMDIKESSSSVIFSITNFGVGIELKNPDEIFSKYVTYANKQKTINSGLGLYIAKRIIDEHGGHIKAESEPKKYVRFTFTIPIK